MLVNDPRGKTYFHYPDGSDKVHFVNHVDPKTTISRQATKDDVKGYPDAWKAFKPGKGKKKTV